MSDIFEIIMEKPTVAIWHGVWIIKISDVGEEFVKWLNGDTFPLPCPMLNDVKGIVVNDWAYYSDYARWVQQSIILD